jgi:Amiloride-sensitive sodium channel
VHIHPPDEIPFFFEDREYKETIFWGSSKEIIVKVVEIENDPSIKNFDIESRKCRFPQEKRPTDLYNVYSYSTCSTECMIMAQMAHCQCTHHLMPQHDKRKSCRV